MVFSNILFFLYHNATLVITTTVSYRIY